MRTTLPDTTPERATYRGLFGVGEFRSLFFAHVVSMLGTIVATLALSVLVFQRTDSPALSALTFTASFLPYLFGGALLGGLVDRWPARRTMVACDLLSAVVFGAMALQQVPTVALLGLAFVGGLVAAIFSGTRAALLADLLGAGPVYVLGRAMMRVVSQGAQVVGLLLGGLLLGSIGARGALIADSLSFAVSAVVNRLGLAPHKPVAAGSSSILRDSLSGLGAVLGHRETRRLLLLRWIVPTCAVAPEALGVAYIHSIGAPEQALGIYLAAIPAGMVVTDLLVGRFASARTQRRILVPGALLTTLPLLGWLVAPDLGLAVALLVLVGIGFCHGLSLDALLVETAPEHLQSRTLAIDQAGLMFLQGVGFGVWGIAGQVLSLQTAIVVAGVCGTIAVLWWVATERRHSRHKGAATSAP